MFSSEAHCYRVATNRSDQRNNVEESAFTMVTLLFIFRQRDGDS